eukprot:TRINITY_DN7256_c0_g1_i2.p1 TRINITY_DN7256_c0_g1~~TRINITY_DN7256_c0_g1_i2.p1  ORF type:complete len:654 (-),score=157.43 TRINITY_DN7256_c0_g1_i2:19-1980(-)
MFLCSKFLTQFDLKKHKLSLFKADNIKRLKIWKALNDEKLEHITVQIDKTYHNSKVIDFLLKCSEFTSKMKLENNEKKTPIHLACAKGSIETVKVLTSKGWNIFQTDADGNRPIFLACKYGHLEIVKHLLSLKANIKYSQYTFSAMHIACKGGFKEIVDVLLNHKADIECEQKDSYTPLHIACENDKLEVTKLLLSRKANIETQKSDGGTPLFIACQNGYLDIVKCLIAEKANINHRKKNKGCALHVACGFKHLNIVEYLISHNASTDIHTFDQDGFTPLMIASKRGDNKIVEHLLSLNVNTETRRDNNTYPRTALMIASNWGSVGVVKSLIAHNANIEAEESPHITSLYIALERKQTAVVDVLLSSGAKMTALTEILIAKQDTYDIPKMIKLFESLIDKAKCLRILSLKNLLSRIDRNEMVKSLLKTKISDPILIRILMDSIVYSIQNGDPLLPDPDIPHFIAQLKEFEADSYVNHWIPWFKFYLLNEKPSSVVKTRWDDEKSLHVDISPDGLQCKAKFPSVSPYISLTNKYVKQGKWCFEVSLGSGVDIQIGYASQKFQLKNTIGADDSSWGINLSQGLKLHNGQSSPFGSGKKWDKGVIQCLLDLDQRIMSFKYKDDQEIAFQNFTIEDGLCPAISSTSTSFLKIETTGT